MTLGGGALTFDPQTKEQPKRFVVDKHGWPNAIACPSTKQCTLVDREGNEVTFNPLSVHPKRVRVDSFGINAIACPTSHECVGADRHGRVVAGAPGEKWKTSTLSTGTRLEAVTCISKSECVVVDSVGDAYVGR